MQTQIDDVYTKTEVDTLLTNPLATTYTTSLTFQDVAGTGVNTLQIKGGTSGIQVIDLNNNSLMDLDNTQISVNKPLVCSTTGNFTGNVTAPNLYSKTQVDTLIANIPLSSYYTQTQLDTMFSTYYLKTDVDTLLSSKQDNLSNASGEVGVESYPLLLNNTIKHYHEYYKLIKDDLKNETVCNNIESIDIAINSNF